MRGLRSQSVNPVAQQTPSKLPEPARRVCDRYQDRVDLFVIERQDARLVRDCAFESGRRAPGRTARWAIVATSS